MSFWIVTDIACDLPRDYVEKQKKFIVLSMPYRLNGEDLMYNMGDESKTPAYYDSLRDGGMATTAHVSLMDYQRTFRELTLKGESVLCITFSSGLSGSYQAAVMAQNMLLEETPNARLIVIDSLCASLGEGLLVHYALKQRDEGKSLEEVSEWLVDNRQKLIHWFTVDDLDFLRRGGRVSATAAYIGSMLKIKPVLHVNFEGKLIPREKVQGRKRLLKALAQKCAEFAVPKTGQTVFISHGDCLQDAQYVASYLRELVPSIKDILISPVDCIIGAHSGPGTVAIFFLGNGR